ncbi:MAG: DUF1579 domain-containing protein [Planctomycetes bacterium]|nr:DUF1579 domain-containing protein [Planctomycetota bacterium]
MDRKKLVAPALIVAAGLAIVVGSIAIADPSRESKPTTQPEMKLPPGWTEADMQACVRAGTPGKMHEHLAKSVGEWRGQTTMWMVPDAEPTKGECTSTVKSILDGRYTKIKMSGQGCDMGPYEGLGIYGFDNVSQKFVSVWIDNHSTGIMNGVGAMSEDGKTITWEFTVNCPITQKPTVLREIETITGPDTKTLEMFATDHKSGKEFKMMTIKLTKKEGDARTSRR